MTLNLVKVDVVEDQIAEVTAKGRAARIAIDFDDDRKKARDCRQFGLLAASELYEDEWAVVHVPTGKTVAGKFCEEEKAVRYLKSVLPLADWSKKTWTLKERRSLVPLLVSLLQYTQRGGVTQEEAETIALSYQERVAHTEQGE